MRGDFIPRDRSSLTIQPFDCVVVARDHPSYDLELIRENAKCFVDARDHVYEPFAPDSLTAAERWKNGDENAGVYTVYTGIVPIVYKAQRALFNSLVNRFVFS